MKFWFITTLLFLSSCQSLYFFPMKDYIWNPKLAGFEFTNHKIQVVNSAEELTIWEIKPKTSLKGNILFLHGNAENVSTHSQGMLWLVNEGYTVFALDYRGYGESTGAANVDNALSDIKIGLNWSLSQIPENEKLIVFGQSIGASLAIFALANDSSNERIKLFVFDSPFSNYSRIVDDKLSFMGILPPFKNLISLIAYTGSNPDEVISGYPENKVLLVHNEDDPVVDFYHSENLFEKLKKPNYFWYAKAGGHTGYFASLEHKKKLLEFLE